MVGASGFEPPTSWSRTRRSNQAEPRPEPTSIVSGGTSIRQIAALWDHAAALPEKTPEHRGGTNGESRPAFHLRGGIHSMIAGRVRHGGCATATAMETVTSCGNPDLRIAEPESAAETRRTCGRHAGGNA